MTGVTSDQLRHQAEAHVIATSYRDWRGRRAEVGEQTPACCTRSHGRPAVLARRAGDSRVGPAGGRWPHPRAGFLPRQHRPAGAGGSPSPLYSLRPARSWAMRTRSGRASTSDGPSWVVRSAARSLRGELSERSLGPARVGDRWSLRCLGLEDAGDETQICVGAVNPRAAQRPPGYALPSSGKPRRGRLGLSQPVRAGRARSMVRFAISAIHAVHSQVLIGSFMSVGAEHVGERGAHAQDQDRQAGHVGGDRPRRAGHPGLGEQVVGDLPGHAEQRASRSRTTWRTGGSGR